MPAGLTLVSPYNVSWKPAGNVVNSSRDSSASTSGRRLREPVGLCDRGLAPGRGCKSRRSRAWSGMVSGAEGASAKWERPAKSMRAAMSRWAICASDTKNVLFAMQPRRLTLPVRPDYHRRLGLYGFYWTEGIAVSGTCVIGLQWGDE